MSSCGSVRGRLLDVVRGSASDAVRLEVESHLEGCAGCREERAAWSFLGDLRDQPAPRLGAAAERRVLERLVATRAPVAGLGGDRPPGARVRWRVGVPALAVLALIVVIVAWPRLRAHGPTARDVVVEGETLEAAQSGAVAFAGAAVAYRAGTALAFHPGARTLELSRGEVDVDVDGHSGLPGRFLVRAPRFIVEVIGTRFVVTPAGVRTLRGRVRVLDLQGHEVAVLHAGDTWQGAGLVEAPPVAPPVVPAPAPTPQPEAPRARPTPRAPVVARGPSVAELLARGRSALAAGEASQARGLIDRALASHPTEAEAAAGELLQADALLVARRPDGAISAYRRVARRRPGAPEGETAAFAVGQLLFERGAQAEAGAALYDYLARYPHGRFVREARERVTQLKSSP